MNWLEAVLLGIIEGLTEFLPVSSTGHLILVAKWLGHDSKPSDTFNIVVQLGAVIAVIVYYRKLLLELIRGALRRDPDKLRLAVALLIAFIPAATLGFLFGDAIERSLMAPVPVAGALIVGGL